MTLVNEAEAGQWECEESEAALPVPWPESSQACAHCLLNKPPPAPRSKTSKVNLIAIAQTKQASPVGHENTLLRTLCTAFVTSSSINRSLQTERFISIS